MIGKPTALDEIIDEHMTHCDGCAAKEQVLVAAARRELKVLREYTESIERLAAIRHNMTPGRPPLVEEARVARAQEAYRLWLAEQEKKS